MANGNIKIIFNNKIVAKALSASLRAFLCSDKIQSKYLLLTARN